MIDLVSKLGIKTSKNNFIFDSKDNDKSLNIDLIEDIDKLINQFEFNDGTSTYSETHLRYLEGLNHYILQGSAKTSVDKFKTADGDILKALKQLESDIPINLEVKNKFIKSLYVLQLNVLFIGISKLKQVLFDVLTETKINKSTKYINVDGSTTNLDAKTKEEISKNIETFFKSIDR